VRVKSVAHYIYKIKEDVIFAYFNVNSAVHCVKVDVVGRTFIMTRVRVRINTQHTRLVCAVTE